MLGVHESVKTNVPIVVGPRQEVMDGDCAALDGDVIVEDSEVVRAFDEDCAVFDEDDAVEDDEVVEELDINCAALDDEIVEDTRVVGVRVELLYIAETAQEHISVGCTIFTTCFPLSGIDQPPLETSHTYHS